MIINIGRAGCDIRIRKCEHTSVKSLVLLGYIYISQPFRCIFPCKAIVLFAQLKLRSAARARALPIARIPETIAIAANFNFIEFRKFGNSEIRKFKMCILMPSNFRISEPRIALEIRKSKMCILMPSNFRISELRIALEIRKFKMCILMPSNFRISELRIALEIREFKMRILMPSNFRISELRIALEIRKFEMCISMPSNFRISEFPNFRNSTKMEIALLADVFGNSGMLIRFERFTDYVIVFST
jgi:hypothetical protein